MNYDFKSIWKISFPVLISFLLEQLVGITDVIFLGRLNTVAIGAAGLGATYFLALFMIISGFSLGAQIIISRRNGEKNFKKTGEIFYQGLFFLSVLSLVLIGASKIFSAHMLKNLIDDESVFKATVEYVNWRILGLWAASIIMMFRAFFVGIAKTSVLQIASIVMVVCNIFLNYALIFGHFGFAPLGVKGAAIASMMSEFMAVGVYVLYLKYKTDVKKYGFDKFVYKNFALLKSILSISIWTMLQQFVSVSTWFLFFIAVEHLGQTELAISNILKNSAGLPWGVVFAFGAAAGTITGNLIGEGRASEVVEATKKVALMNTKIILGCLVFFALFCVPILRIYTNDVGLIQKSILPYLTALLCYIPLLSGWCWFQAASGTGHARYTMFIELIAMLFYTFYIGFVILYLKMPLYVCMLSDGVYNLVVFVMSYQFMHSGKWQNKAV